MGTYLNPGNSGFAEMLRSDYIDKTGMIGLINKTIGTTNKLTCISRPRRFGKSFAAKMLCAYYDKTCNSENLFNNRHIAKELSYRQHLNKYDVIYVDISGLKTYTDNYRALVPFLIETITEELLIQYPSITPGKDFPTTLVRAVTANGGARERFIMIIDEWDAPIREGDSSIQQEYLEFLRSLFKNSGVTSQVFAAAYMTGILPIKKDKSQSAISDFREYTILYPGPFAEYTGFTEEEVCKECAKNKMSFEEAKAWYDGYDFPGFGNVYNPYSLMCAMNFHDYRSYWQQSSAAEALLTYINLDFQGLQELVLRLIAGEQIEVNVNRFKNDLQTFTSRDDVLTLLIHLGYLTYDSKEHTVRIPNEELRLEFDDILTSNELDKAFVKLIQNSRKLLEDTIAGNEEAVAEAIRRVHESQYAPTFYNNEQALRYVVKYAYIACVGQYMKIEELPSGHGIADVVFIPKRFSPLPALIVELKWNKSSEQALEQIDRKRYDTILRQCEGEIIHVGIGYDPKSGEHICRIRKIET